MGIPQTQACIAKRLRKFNASMGKQIANHNFSLLHSRSFACGMVGPVPRRHHEMATEHIEEHRRLQTHMAAYT